MAKDHLQLVDAAAEVAEPDGERMPESVRVDALVEASLLREVHEVTPHAIRVGVPKQAIRRRLSPTCAAKHCGDGLHSRASGSYQAVLRALAVDRDRAGVRVDVSGLDVQDLGTPEPATNQEQEQSAV